MTRLSDRHAPSPVHAVVFDFDGTIVDTETPVFESWRQTYAAYAVEPLSRSEWRSHIGTTSQPFHPLDELERRLVEAGKTVDRAELVEQRLALRNEMLACVEVRPGIVEWIDAASGLGVGIAVASSSPRSWVDEQLDRLDMKSWFAIVSCAGNGVAGKPEPTVYQIACAGLGVDPGTAIAVEDSPVGAEAAAAAGLYVIAAPGPMTTGLRFAHADVEVSSLADLAPLEWLGSR